MNRISLLAVTLLLGDAEGIRFLSNEYDQIESKADQDLQDIFKGFDHKQEEVDEKKAEVKKEEPVKKPEKKVEAKK